MRAVNNVIKNQAIALYVLMAIFYTLGNVFKNAQAYFMVMIQMKVIQNRSIIHKKTNISFWEAVRSL